MPTGPPTAFMVNLVLALPRLPTDDQVDDVVTALTDRGVAIGIGPGVDVTLTAFGADMPSALADGIAVASDALTVGAPVRSVLRADVSTDETEGQAGTNRLSR